MFENKKIKTYLNIRLKFNNKTIAKSNFNFIFYTVI